MLNAKQFELALIVAICVIGFAIVGLAFVGAELLWK